MDHSPSATSSGFAGIDLIYKFSYICFIMWIKGCSVKFVGFKSQPRSRGRSCHSPIISFYKTHNGPSSWWDLPGKASIIFKLICQINDFFRINCWPMYLSVFSQRWDKWKNSGLRCERSPVIKRFLVDSVNIRFHRWGWKSKDKNIFIPVISLNFKILSQVFIPEKWLFRFRQWEDTFK